MTAARTVNTVRRVHPWRWYRALPLNLRLFLPLAVALTAGALLVECQWYSRAPEGNPTFGVNFSCPRARWAGQDCDRLLAETLDDLGVRQFRLAVEWSIAEPAPGVYDWSEIERQLDALQTRGARAVVTVGMKAPRWPDFWFPPWLTETASIPAHGYPEDVPGVAEALFPFLDATVRRLTAHPAVEAFQVENEPFVYYRGHAQSRRLRPAFVERELAIVRAADGGAHRIVISHASWFRGDPTPGWILDHADALLQSFYTKRQQGPWHWFYLFPYHTGPLAPNLPNQARDAARHGKELWIGELEAEPYESHQVDPRAVPPEQLRSFSPAWLQRNVALARRSGATRVYLWGVEWWALTRDRGDPRLWDAGRALLRDGGASAHRQ